ncbi:MAG: hypothetical protein FJW34_03170 [Acidobacteria bacterium]|nr:hypothetical protein [Acidobacteriota bacterium]
MRLLLLLLAGLSALVCPGLAQRADLRVAEQIDMPARVDSNSPAFWREGRFHLINSDGAPALHTGASQLELETSEGIVIQGPERHGMWIEATWADSDGTVYAWYHHEPGILCPGTKLTAPEIGALVSHDGGKSFSDLGLILTSGDRLDCAAKNGLFAGGHGDFSVILDREGRYFYFLFGNYGGDTFDQGIALARMAFEDRVAPAGAVWKYHAGGWGQPGLGGRVTPVFPVSAGWQQAETNAYWGPSVHWNTYLESYVVLMSHSCCRPLWPQAGVYVSFNPDVSDPLGWTVPQQILDRPVAYYPQVLGAEAGETDTLAGRVARFYLQGWSGYEIVFTKVDPNVFDPEEPPEPYKPERGRSAPARMKPPVSAPR